MSYKIVRNFYLLGWLAIVGAVPINAAVAQDAPEPSSAEIARQLAALEQQQQTLQEQLRVRRIAEAQSLLAEEVAAAARAREATVRANEARSFLASQSVPATTSSQTPVAGAEDGQVAAAAQNKDPEGNNGNNQAGFSQQHLRDGDRTTTFGGIDFGVGVSFSYDLGGELRVREAELVNGIVRVTEADNARARLILESHYFFTPAGRSIFGLQNTAASEGSSAANNWGIGPFIALQPGSDAIIDAIGGGLMMGFRRPGEGDDSFNFGIGVLYDVDVRTLGPGIEANQPLPDGETEIRYQQREQASILFISSYSF